MTGQSIHTALADIERHHSSIRIHILFMFAAGSHLALVGEVERSRLGQVSLFRSATGQSHLLLLLFS